MAKSKQQNIIDQFTKLRPNYESFTQKLESLIRDLLESEDIKYQLIESRVKSLDSLREKLQRPGKNYSSLQDDIPDLSGVRIIVYYSDDIPKVSALISNEFDIVEREESHQVSNYDVNTFGYLSMHYVARLNDNRTALPEWGGFAGLKSEVQVRTVLQHSWAAISHALQYKRESDVPSISQRRLFRLAGLFELADEEFLRLRNERQETREDAIKSISKKHENLSLDVTTVDQFISSWKKLGRIKTELRKLNYKIIDDNEIDQESIGDIILLSQEFGITTIKELETLISAPYGEFFKLIEDDAPVKWSVTDGFIVLLLLIRSKSKTIPKNILLETDNWHNDVLERVLRGARQSLL